MQRFKTFGNYACIFSLCLTVSLLSVSSSSGADLTKGDWPQWRGPDRNGISPEQNLNWDWEQNKPKLLWTAEGVGNGYAGVAIQNNRIYTTGNGEVSQAVTAFDANNGERIWFTKLTKDVPKHGYEGARCTPAVEGDHLYVISSNGDLFCLKTEDGSIVWEKNFVQEWDGKMMSKWGFSESPLIDGDWVLCTPGGDDAMMVALDKKTGEEIWRSPAPTGTEAGKDGAGYASIMVTEAAGVKQYVQMTGRGVIGVRASDGKLLWNYNKIANAVANIPDVVPFGDDIFCSTGYGTGAALIHLSPNGDGVKAEEVYFLNASTFQNHHGGMVRLGEYIYAGQGHNNGFPICLHIPTGEVKWGGKIRGVGKKSAAIAAADGHLIYRYQSGELASVKATPDGYELVGKFKPEIVNPPAWAHPSISNGKLYLREQGALMCYDISK